MVARAVVTATARRTSAPTVSAEDVDAEQLAPVASNATLVEPVYLAHRGGANLYPESTTEGYRRGVVAGIRAIEMDIWKLADNALAVMHDGTVDRTTTSTGNVTAFQTSSWRALQVDAGTWFGGGWANTLNPPMFADLLAEFGGRVVMVPEAKSTCEQDITALVVAAGRQNSVILQSFFSANLTAPAAAGLGCMFLANASSEPNYASLLSSGIRYLGLDSTNSNHTPWVTNAANAGMKPFVYVIDRQFDRDTYLGLGATGFFSNDPLYTGGPTRSNYRRTTDPWSTQTYYHGHLASQNGIRGQYTAPNQWGYSLANQFDAVLQGWCSPLASPSNFTLTFEVILDSVQGGDTTRWIALFVATNDLAWTNSGSTPRSGYQCLFRGNGRVDLFRVDNGVSTTLASVASTAPTLGSTVARLRLTVTPTTVTWQRLDVAATSGAIADATYRGVPYAFLCRTSSAARFQNMTVG